MSSTWCPNKFWMESYKWKSSTIEKLDDFILEVEEWGL